MSEVEVVLTDRLATPTLDGLMWKGDKAKLDGLGLEVAMVRRATMQSIPNNTTTTVSWDQEVEDSPGWFDATAPGILVVKAAGFYQAYVNLQFASSVAGVRQAVLGMGGDIAAAPVFGVGEDANCRQQVFGSARLAAGGVVKLNIYQNSGAALGFGPELANPVPSLTVVRLK
jgi:hypothetical protein